METDPTKRIQPDKLHYTYKTTKYYKPGYAHRNSIHRQLNMLSIKQDDKFSVFLTFNVSLRRK